MCICHVSRFCVEASRVHLPSPSLSILGASLRWTFGGFGSFTPVQIYNDLYRLGKSPAICPSRKHVNQTNTNQESALVQMTAYDGCSGTVT